MFKEWITRLRFLIFPKRHDEIDEELQFHIEQQTQANIASGMTTEEAHYAALRAFGNPTLIREQTSAVWSWNCLDNILRDLKISTRTLLRSPGFSIIAVLVMALCIGAATSLFTVMRSVLLRPLPFRDPARLIMLYEHFRDPDMTAQGSNAVGVSPGNYYDWRAKTNGFEDMAALRWWQFNLTGERGELPELLEARGATSNLFPLLGVDAVIGRTFTQSEDRQDGDVAMLAWSFFERRFGSDSSIVGKQIHLDGKPYTVVGILPKWFAWPDAKVQIWVPYASGLPPAVLEHHDYHFSRVVARLRRNVALASALSQIEAMQYAVHTQNLNASVAEDIVSKTLIDDLAHDVTKPLIILLSAAGCMLLIGCLNVANLQVARSAARQKEIAVRSALGAQRTTLIREQLMENLLLSMAGGVAGAALSLAATKFLASAWKDLSSAQSIHADGVVLAFVCAIVLASALLAGLLPAITSTGKGAIAALQASSRSAAGSRSRTALRKTLLTVEIAATVVLLIAAGLLLKSFWQLRTTDVGCVTQNVLTMSYSLPINSTPEKLNAFNEALLERVRSLPGVRAAALGTTLPGAGWGGNDAFTIPEHAPIKSGASPDALFRRADPGYFTALQIPLLSGRFFTSHDRVSNDRGDHPATIIISRELARQYFPGEDPVGKHIRDTPRDTEYEIIGVVADTLYQVGQPAKPTMYFPILEGRTDGMAFALAVRTESSPLALSVPVQKEIAKLDPQLPVSNVLTMQQTIEQSLGNASLSANLVLAFAVLSLLLAAIGLYGVLSYMMTQRTGEIGIRVALGAERKQVLHLMLGDALRPALYGLVLGLAASAAAVRLIESMLYETPPLDPVIYAAVATTLLGVAALSCIVPAWKASRIEPMQALRAE